ncbi:MAG: prepilin-type N-terminal cleavage/methylation domain-containing protein [bacterium]
MKISNGAKIIIKKNNNNSGISIIEVVIAVMIIAMGMIGVLSLVIQNVKSQYINKNVLMASGLAGEGLELVRNIRDLNWLTTENTWNQNIVGDGTYTIDYGGLTSINAAVNLISDAGARLYINSNGLYTHTASGNTPTNFYRLITVIDQGDYLDVRCTVRWKDGTQNHNYMAETYLYNWR